MLSPIYADNAATTKIRPCALKAMNEVYENTYGNPSSSHSIGFAARAVLEQARKDIAMCIGANPHEIIFTSGASESNTTAMDSLGYVYGPVATDKDVIITTTIEHHSILYELDYMKQENPILEIQRAEPNRHGIVRGIGDVLAENCDSVYAVSVMYANNETGMIQPIKEIGELCQERNIIFHTDATQAVGHIPVNVETDCIDMLSASAHKFGGPRGIGFLYVRKGILFEPLIIGGGQESGRRGGTEDVPAIAGMAAALKESVANMKKDYQTCKRIQRFIVDGILRNVPGAKLTGTMTNRLPNNVHFCFEGIYGETLAMKLNESYGICVSAGSACTTGTKELSHVLTAMGIRSELALGALRITFSPDMTIEQAGYLVNAIKETAEELRSYNRPQK